MTKNVQSSEILLLFCLDSSSSQLTYILHPGLLFKHVYYLDSLMVFFHCQMNCVCVQAFALLCLCSISLHLSHFNVVSALNLVL